jgi:hypothetical protein
MVVAPDYPEWNRPGILNYEPGQLGDGLDRAMALGCGGRAIAVQLSRSYIQDHLTLPIVNEQRIEILKGFE